MARTLFLTMVLSMLAVSSVCAQANREVYRVSVAERADGKGYVVRLHARGKVSADDLTVDQVSLKHAQVIVSRASLSKSVLEEAVAGPVLDYSLSEEGRDLKVDLTLDPQRPVQIVAYGDRASDDALIALTYASVPAPGMRYAGSVEPGHKEEFRQTRKTEPRPPRVVFAALAPDPPENPVSPVSGEAWNLDCVVIDAGHGGKDPGAVAYGVREKDVNLAVAKKLGFYIEDRLGLNVVYTRDDDRFVPLAERGRIANDECGKLFISIHVNSARRRSANGTEIYFLGLHKTDAALEVMERENSVIRLESNPDQYADLTGDQAILETLAQSVYLRESEHLADLVHMQFRDRAQRPTRGVKQAGFLVLWKASMPAILVELGFVTNKSEARYLNSSRGHDLLASAIFRAVRDYRNAYQKGFEWTAAD